MAESRHRAAPDNAFNKNLSFRDNFTHISPYNKNLCTGIIIEISTQD
jgi:hypothetical protein